MFIPGDAIIVFLLLGIFLSMVIITVMLFLINNSLKKLIKKDSINK